MPQSQESVLVTVMGTLTELVAKIAHALNISLEQAGRIVWVTLHPDSK